MATFTANQQTLREKELEKLLYKAIQQEKDSRDQVKSLFDTIKKIKQEHYQDTSYMNQREINLHAQISAEKEKRICAEFQLKEKDAAWKQYCGSDSPQEVKHQISHLTSQLDVQKKENHTYKTYLDETYERSAVLLNKSLDSFPRMENTIRCHIWDNSTYDFKIILKLTSDSCYDITIEKIKGNDEGHPLYNISVNENDDSILEGMIVKINPISYEMIRVLMLKKDEDVRVDTGNRPFPDYQCEVLRGLSYMEV